MSNFLDELKRRKVFRVAASYAVVAFIIMQLVEILFPMFNFPQWTQQFTVIIVLLGFPIAVILSWVFDKTSEGLVKTDEKFIKDTKTSKNRSNSFFFQKKYLILILGIACILFISSFSRELLGETDNDKSIAVLPFNNFSKDKDDEYFSDGITEDITMNLAKVKDLTVISRTSVMGYKGTTKKMKVIAEELGVKYILEGSVRKIGDRVRVVGQLIDANKDKHIWSDSYDREMTDLFEIQADVSKKIANAMEAKLSNKTLTQIETVPTDNMDAYILYQRARSYYGMYTNDGNEIAINLLKEALEIDRNYALAYAGLADCYGQRVIRFNYSEDWIVSALHVSDLALKINPNLAEAFKAKGLAYLSLSMNEKFGFETDKALGLNPGFHTAVANKGIYLFRSGNLFDSQDYFIKSIRLNPTSTSTEKGSLSDIYFILDEQQISNSFIENAIKNSPNVVMPYEIGLSNLFFSNKLSEAKEIIDLFEKNIGNNNQLNIFKGYYHYYKKDYKTAELFLSKSISEPYTWRSSGSVFSQPFYLIKTLYHNKKPYFSLLDEGIKTLENKISNGADFYSLFVELSAMYALRSKSEKSLDFLEESIQNGFRNKYVLNDTAFESIRNNDRFKLLKSEIDIYVQKEKNKFRKAGLIN